MKITDNIKEAFSAAKGLPVVAIETPEVTIYFTGFSSSAEVQNLQLSLIDRDGVCCGQISMQQLDQVGSFSSEMTPKKADLEYAFASVRQRAEHLKTFDRLVKAKAAGHSDLFAALQTVQAAAARECPLQVEIVGPWGPDFIVGAMDDADVHQIQCEFLKHRPDTEIFRTIKDEVLMDTRKVMWASSGFSEAI